MSRVENFSKADAEANYQAEKAKIAVASGEIYGRGPGKSNQKNFLPQSSSDFIYAIIVEEYGLIGGLFLLVLYLALLFRIVIVANKTETIFGTLLVLGVGIPIVFQAFIKYGSGGWIVSGYRQPLPLMSAGGTSIWMTCFALGIVLSVSANREAKLVKQKDSNDDENPLRILHEAIVNILISGGGTGGHIYPAIAIANELRERYTNANFLFVGASDRMEMEKVPQAGYKIKGLVDFWNST